MEKVLTKQELRSMSAQEKRGALHEKFGEIAKFLGGTWRYCPKEEGCCDHFKDGEGREFYAYVDYRGQCEIKGNYPVFKDGRWKSLKELGVLSYNDKELSIGVDITKDAEKISKDITRRFLPKFFELHKKAAEKIRELEKEEQKKEEIANELMSIFGSEFSVGALGKLVMYNDNGCLISVDIIGVDHIDFTVCTLNKNEALKLAQFLVNTRKENRGNI